MLSAAKVGVYEAQVKRIGLISCPKQVFLGLSQVSDLKKGATPAVDAAPCCFIQDNPTLRDLDGLGNLLLRLHFWHGDGQDAVHLRGTFPLGSWSL